MPNGLSWEPVRTAKGGYCSPACGRGCTYEEYKYARQRARTLAQRLGENWKPRVWENLGWYYAVSAGGITISEPERAGEYTVGFTESGRVGAHIPEVFVARSFRTPEAAVRAQIARVRAWQRAIERALAPALVRHKRR